MAATESGYQYRPRKLSFFISGEVYHRCETPAIPILAVHLWAAEIPEGACSLRMYR